VDPATTPRVQYAYSQGSGGNHSRLTRVTYPDGYQVNYAYDGIDAAVSRPTSLSGQSAGSATAVTLEAFRYLGAGTVIERSRSEVNVTLSMVNFAGATADAGDKYTGLDRFGRVVDQRWTQGTTASSPVLDRYGHTYDRNSNRLTRTNALAAAFSETYAYDNLNQLQSFNRSGGTTTSQQWQFDALGNWTTVTTNGVAENRTANAQNELTQVGSSALAYSTTGNLTTDAQGRTLAYDAWSRLVSVKNAAGTEVARYEYDGLNRRIVEQVGTLASPAAATAAIRDVYYSQDRQALEERVRTSPSQVAATADTRFIWSPVYVDAMVARDRNADGNTTTGTGGLEQRVYALQDANWNTTAIIAATGVPGVAAGTVINRFAYTPYGESQTLTASWATPPAGSTPAVPWAHLFQGLEFTDVTALAYVRHRDYSATLGRFIELDPIGFSAGDNNWYRFVANQPLSRSDPMGLYYWVNGGGDCCGPYVWTYTGSWCVKPRVWAAAMDAAAGAVNCWWDCVVTIHQCASAYAAGAAGAVTTLSFTHVEYATGISKPLAGATRLTTLQSRLALLLRQSGYSGIAQRLLRSSAQAVSRAPIGTGIASGAAGVGIVEAGFSIYCGYSCSR